VKIEFQVCQFLNTTTTKLAKTQRNTFLIHSELYLRNIVNNVETLEEGTKNGTATSLGICIGSRNVCN